MAQFDQKSYGLMYATDTDEANAMILTGVWNYEGVGFYGEILG